ncbi:MipA/OmpV family protein [Sulfurimonas sp. HSL-1716]|uniref:MipA/OmpV family protein n=1 Tax=Hydrocurvibacter sulfurireducens TaxID=3131937 RepID=UPI0031F8436C
MRFFLLLFILFFHLIADDKKTPLFIGAGPYIQTQPYKGADAIIVPSPVIFFDNGIFYVRWTRVGLYLFGNSKDNFNWGISLTAQPRPFGYKSSDSAILEDMNRDSSFEAGPALDVEYKNTFFSAVFFHDILNRSNSYIVRAELGHHLAMGKLDFYPSIMAIYHADKFNNYYYGVRQSEATASRPAYSPSSSIDLAFQTYARYAFTEKWSALLNFRADYLGKEEQNSPIVSDKYMFSGLISLMYRLEL